jgi:NhaA family Na+:H+ antiporter
MLPIIAATGGMLFPALIFLVFNQNTSLSSAWGIPVATDIAFALGVMSILGNRVPLSLKIFLTALAIVDDIGAVIVIAVNYSKNIQWDYVLYAFGVIGLLLTFNLLKVKRLRIYLILGIILWFFIMNTGFHATLAGVILAFLIPSSPKISIEEFLKVSKETLEQLIQSDTEDDDHSVAIMQQNAILQIKENTDRIINPSQQLVHILHPIVSFFIMPFFAFVNAGINLTSPAEIFSNPLAIRLSLGIIIGLILGKMIGIFLTSWLAIKLKIASFNDMPTIRQFIGIATFGGIGFTMSIFISNLAISDVGLLNTAKLSVLLASILAALIGIMILWRK